MQRHERLLRQWAAKVINILPADDNDSRKVLAYGNQLLENYLAVNLQGETERASLN